MKRILFHRNYANYTGGHQKVRDYITHAASDSGFEVSLFINNTASVQTTLFDNIPNIKYQKQYEPRGFDFVFLAGLDWRAYLPHMQQNAEADNKAPKLINLIQHMRHGDAQHPLFEFLKYSATRICVSQAVKKSIEPNANGHCMHIPMGHHVPKIKLPKEYDLYILANKRPAWGKALNKWAEGQGLKVCLHSELTPKQAVLNAMAQARVSVCLPNPTEGFYLPGIEAMALSDIAIVPDCSANRAYKHHFDNLIICAQKTESVQHAIEQALVAIKRPWHFVQKLRGKRTVEQYSLQQERQKFLELLHSLK